VFCAQPLCLFLVVPNQGVGAALARIETTRRRSPRIFFNEATAEAGRDALAGKSNEDRNIGLVAKDLSRM